MSEAQERMSLCFEIDGESFDVRVPEDGLTREGQVLDSDQTERLANGSMFRDIIGTYYNYNLNLDARALNPSEYDRLYRILSSPVKSHVIKMPFGQSMIQFDAYCSTVSDTLHRIERPIGGDPIYHWKGMQVSFVAMEPYDTSTLED